MPTELERLSRAMDHMGGRLRKVVVAVVGEASQIGSSASDFSAMSEELAASSGEISTAMVKIAGSAEQQVQGMEKADALLAEPAADRRGERPGGGPGGAAGRPDPGARRAPPRRRGRRGPDPARRARGGPDVRRSRCRSWPGSRSRSPPSSTSSSRSQPDQPAGAQRRHRGGPRRASMDAASRSSRRRCAGWPTPAPAPPRTWPRRCSTSGIRCAASPPRWRSARPRCRGSSRWPWRRRARWRRSQPRWRRCTTPRRRWSGRRWRTGRSWSSSASGPRR